MTPLTVVRVQTGRQVTMGEVDVRVRRTGYGAPVWLLLLLSVLLITTLGAVPPGLTGVAPGMPEALSVPADGIQAGSERAAGELPGRWTVTPTGGFTYMLPPDIPAGRAGMQPSLALAYASGRGNGHLGVGWSQSARVSMLAWHTRKTSWRFMGSGASRASVTTTFWF